MKGDDIILKKGKDAEVPNRFIVVTRRTPLDDGRTAMRNELGKVYPDGSFKPGTAYLTSDDLEIIKNIVNFFFLYYNNIE